MSLGAIVKPWMRTKLFYLCEQFAYGHREVLLFTKGLHNQFAFYAHVQHGWVNDPQLERQTTRNRNFQVTHDLVWSQRVAKQRARVNKNSIVIGSPLSHLLAYIGFTPGSKITEFISVPNDQKFDFIYFPSHGFQDIVMQKTNMKAPTELKDSKGAVSLYWADYVNPDFQRYFQSLNLEPICAGYRGASAFEVPWSDTGGRVHFLVELLRIFSSAEVLVFDEVSTAFWYGVLMGKDILIQSDEYGFSRIQGSNSKNLGVVGIHKVPFGKVFRPTEDLYAAAVEEVGWNHIENFGKVLEKGLLFTPEELLHIPRYNDQIASRLLEVLRKQ